MISKMTIAPSKLRTDFLVALKNEVCYTANMKHVFNIIFYIIASLALGFAIGTWLGGNANQLWLIIAGCVAGGFYLFAFILSGVIISAQKRQRNNSVSLQKNDFVLQMSKTYTVGKREKLHPGEYKVLATDENNKTFNLRVNNYVKEYQHNTTLILAEGDTISARSANVILR